MLKLFGSGRPDHPMADPREARRLLQELPGGDPVRCLEEVTHWIESILATPGFRHDALAEVALMLDEAAQAPARRVGRDYLAAVRLAKAQEVRWWNAIFQFWRHSADLFIQLLRDVDAAAKGAEAIRGELPLIAVRALRALAAQMKWLHVRYGPLDPSLWTLAGAVARFAERRRIMQIEVKVYSAIQGTSTPELEFLRMVLFSAASPDSLLPLENEIAERLVAVLAESATLSPTPIEEGTYWFDLSGGHPPLRHARPPANPESVRFIATGAAARRVEQALDELRRSGALPADLRLGDAYPADRLAEVLAHLAAQWSLTPPARRHERHRVKARLAVVAGFDRTLDSLQPSQSLSFVPEGVESWIAENVSAGGFGALVPNPAGDWLRVDALVAVQPEGGSNWLIGILRRVLRVSEVEAQVGIQTIARTPFPLLMRVEVGELASLDAEVGILAAPPGPDDRSARVVLRAGVHAPGQRLSFEHEGRNYLLTPQATIARGVDYEALDCKLANRESG